MASAALHPLPESDEFGAITARNQRSQLANLTVVILLMFLVMFLFFGTVWLTLFAIHIFSTGGVCFCKNPTDCTACWQL